MHRLFRRQIAFPLLCAAWVACLTTGCITRSVRVESFYEKYTEVFLRGEKRGKTPVDRGYQHPVAISATRLLNILSTIDLRVNVKKGPDRVPAFPTETISRIATGVSKALGEADSGQEVVVLSIRRHKRLGIFDRKFLTSFIVYLRDDSLYLHLSRVEWEVPKHREDNLPEPRLSDRVMDFRVVPARSMYANGAQGVVVNWRDPLFANPVATRRNARGKVVRRTVLMESAIPREERGGDGIADLPEGLNSEEVSALRVLERAREQGDITEAYYQRRREQLLREGSSP